jgi:aspartyl-tRNA(Asn)/glutamyl-tRNA(Gln) amidotransferase subunit C
MISREEIDNLANLARLDLDEAQKATIAKDLGNILDYVKQLKEAEGLDKVEVEDYVATNVMRKDEVINETGKLSSNLVEAAPKHNEQYVRVKKIL